MIRKKNCMALEMLTSAPEANSQVISNQKILFQIAPEFFSKISQYASLQKSNFIDMLCLAFQTVVSRYTRTDSIVVKLGKQKLRTNFSTVCALNLMSNEGVDIAFLQNKMNADKLVVVVYPKNGQLWVFNNHNKKPSCLKGGNAFAKFSQAIKNCTAVNGRYEVESQVTYKLHEIFSKYTSYNERTLLTNLPFSKALAQIEKLTLEQGVKFNLHFVEGIIGTETISGNFSLVFDSKSSGFAIAYNSELFDKEFVQQFINSFQQLLRGIANNPSKKVGEFSIVSESELQEQVYLWNPPAVDFPREKTIHQLFEELVTKTPNDIAVVFGNKKITYATLNARANKLARYIRQEYQQSTGQNLKPNTPIALCLRRNIGMIIAIIAVLKAGGSYVPIYPDYPNDRISYILEDTSTSLVLTQIWLQRKLEKILAQRHQASKKSLPRIISINNKITQKDLEKLSKSNIGQINKSTDLAYHIYTSGSTGKPKGVMCSHKCAVNRFTWVWKNLPFKRNEVCGLQANYSFVDAVWEIFGPLCGGSKLIVMPDNVLKDPKLLIDRLIKTKITRYALTPSYLQALLESYPKKFTKAFQGLTHLEISGEKLSKPLLEKTIKLFPHTAIYDRYGATEATSFIYKKIGGSLTKQKNLVISNTHIYILDKNLNRVPFGAIGELHVSGDLLANGYLNLKKLTNERFIPNPFSNSSSRLYRTRDLAIYSRNGDINILGRLDRVDKIRGFRVELAGIETVLEQHPVVRNVIVIPRIVNEQKCLVAYIISTKKAIDIDSDKFSNTLRIHARKSLPEYMLPGAFVFLDKFPLNSNGKRDYSALQVPKREQRMVKELYVAPSTQLEKNLVLLWSKFLPTSKIGVKDNFFHAGGNSLTAPRLVSEIKKSYNTKLPLNDFFDNPTIKYTADIITGKETYTNKTSLELALKDSYYSLELGKINDTKVCKNALLTGATGFLGVHLLNQLLSHTKSKIYCLIRGKNDNEIKGKLTQSLIKFRFLKSIDWSRLILVRGDFDLINFGISKEKWNELEHEIDVIYHNGAQVNHLFNYETLRATNVQSTKRLIKFAITGKLKAFHYISTIIAGSTATTLTSFQNGYILTKFVCEKILANMAEKRLPVTIYRPGKIMGHSKTGAINAESNHQLLLLKGCIQMGYAPSWDYSFEMTPVDIVSKAIVKLSLKAQSGLQIYNLQNPTQIKWCEYISAVNRHGFNVKLIDTGKWNKKLEKIDSDNSLFILKSLYLDKHKSTYAYPDSSNTQTKLKTLKVIYPTEQNELLQLIKLYLNYLLNNEWSYCVIKNFLNQKEIFRRIKSTNKFFNKSTSRKKAERKFNSQTNLEDELQLFSSQRTISI